MRSFGWLSTHLCIGLTSICTTHALHAQSACQAQLLVGSDTAQADIFGASVVISDDTMGVGAWRDDDNGDNAGAAYVFRFEQQAGAWIEVQKLLASDGAAYDNFGQEIAIDGDLAVVSAPYDDTEDCPNPPCNHGSVYVFRFNGKTAAWVQIQKLVPTDSEPEELFGTGLALSGSVLVAGAPLDSDNGSEAGAAYVFRFDGTLFVEEQKLLPLDGAVDDRFGIGVDIDGNIAVIGARRHDESGVQAGAAYVFQYNADRWIQQQELHASDAAPLDRFGRSIALEGNVMVIGARQDDVVGIDSGSAYVFRYDGVRWQEEQKLVPSDGAANDWFGECVAISGGTILVGAVTDDDNGNGSGSAYVFRYDGSTWTEVDKLMPMDAAAADFFGGSVSLAGDVAVIGATGNDDSGIDAGSAYVFAGLSGIDCNANAVADSCDILFQNSQDSNQDGVPDECECPWDCGDGDGEVDIDDFLAVIAEWGTMGTCDFDGNGVDIDDFLAVIANWGPCP